jgi:hypothetical protein
VLNNKVGDGVHAVFDQVWLEFLFEEFVVLGVGHNLFLQDPDTRTEMRSLLGLFMDDLIYKHRYVGVGCLPQRSFPVTSNQRDLSPLSKDSYLNLQTVDASAPREQKFE